MKKEPILRVNRFSVSFSQYSRGLRRKELEVITGLDLELYEGEILAVVGSSGSGKSLLASAILGILPDNAVTEGELYYQGQLLMQKDRERLRGREIVLIPQSVNYLDPLLPVGKQIGISIRNPDKREEAVKTLLEKYGLKKETAESYPFQLSGGMARKVLLATALAAEAKIIIADEPTPGLDEVSINEVLKDFRDMADTGSSVLMITHDIEAALQIADRIAVFYAGTTLEVSNVRDFEHDDQLRHPYTKALNRARTSVEFASIEGSQPFPGNLPKGCLFSDRCGIRTEKCDHERPGFRELRGGKVRCIHAT